MTDWAPYFWGVLAAGLLAYVLLAATGAVLLFDVILTVVLGLFLVHPYGRALNMKVSFLPTLAVAVVYLVWNLRSVFP